METDDDRSKLREKPRHAILPARATGGHKVVGRESELAELKERLELRDGPLQVTGAPGIGKSALLHALSSVIPCRVVDVSGEDKRARDTLRGAGRADHRERGRTRGCCPERARMGVRNSGSSTTPTSRHVQRRIRSEKRKAPHRLR